MKTLQGQKYLWKLPETHREKVLKFAAAYNLSFPISQTLVTRGFDTKKAIDEYLFSSFEKDVPSASKMKDALKAVERLELAIEKKEKILICGDYDVDGITSSAMIMYCLLPLGADINFFLPNRVRDGYGLSPKIIKRAAQNKYKVVITVDNGITAIEPAKCAKELGIDLIITDHHRPHAQVPDAFAVVNPNQKDCEYPFKVLAGVGVAFKVMSLLYERRGLTMPEKMYELLLLGTVADVVPLKGENRFWVRYGLSYINKFESLAFKVLKQNGKVIKPKISATDIGFNITPQINALGRLEDARQGVQFLIGTDVAQVQEIGRVLLELNKARREIERGILAEVETEILEKRIDLEVENVIIAASTKWQPGVIGLVASRLVSKYGRPTLLFHLTKDGLAKGSCRSIPAFNIFDALESSKDLIKQFGGHSMAAGLALPVDNLSALKEKLEQLVKDQLTEDDLKLKIDLDAQVSLSDLTKKFMGDMEHLQPFGNENKEPLFFLKGVTLIEKPTLLKDLHVKCRVFADGVIKPLIFFNRPELFEKFMAQGEEPFDAAVRVSENHWNGRVSIELMGVDVALVEGK